MNVDWVVMWVASMVGPIVSALVCWRWLGPSAPAWKLLPAALLANPMMWLLLAASMGVAHLGPMAAILIILSGFLSVLAGLAWRSFKNRGAA